MSLNLSRKAGGITMIQNTLYNSGGYIKRSKFFIVLWASFYCIPDIIKVSARHVFGRKNTSASMLRIYKNKSIPPYGHWDCMSIISVSFYDVRFPIEYQHSIQCFKKTLSIMASPCEFCIQKNKYSCFKKNIYIMYIYINSTLVSVNHITYKKYLKIFVADEK